MRVPLTKPWFENAEVEAVVRPLSSGWVAQGRYVNAFEQSVAQVAGCSHAVACSSGTTALHLALLAAGVGKGDAVIVPSFTWIATANAVAYCGAQPLFCDIDLSTFNIDVGAIERLITSRTRAIVVVHQFGLPADMRPVLEIARRHDLVVIEDAACALGASYGGQPAGSLGQLAAFSFHPRKIITTGEGGMVVTDSTEYVARLRALRNHGCVVPVDAPPSVIGDFDDLGFNYRMTDIQGALGVSQMERLDSVLHLRRERAARYDAALSQLPWLAVPQTPADRTHTFQSYVCLVRTQGSEPAVLQSAQKARDRLILALHGAGIGARPGTHAVHALGYYRTHYGYSAPELPNALFADHASVALPLYPQMTDEEQDYVITHIVKYDP